MKGGLLGRIPMPTLCCKNKRDEFLPAVSGGVKREDPPSSSLSIWKVAFGTHAREPLASPTCDSVRVLGQSPWAACSLACAVGHEPLLADEFALLGAKVVDHAAKPTVHTRQQVCSCWCQYLVAWLPDRRPDQVGFPMSRGPLDSCPTRPRHPILARTSACSATLSLCAPS